MDTGQGRWSRRHIERALEIRGEYQSGNLNRPGSGGTSV